MFNFSSNQLTLHHRNRISIPPKPTFYVNNSSLLPLHYFIAKSSASTPFYALKITHRRAGNHSFAGRIWQYRVHILFIKAMSCTRGKVTKRSRLGADDRRRQPLAHLSGSHSGGEGGTRRQPPKLPSSSHFGAEDRGRQPHPQYSGSIAGTYYSGRRVLIRGGKTTRPTNREGDNHPMRQTFPYNYADVDDDELYEYNNLEDVDATLPDSPRDSPSESPRDSPRNSPRDSQLNSQLVLNYGERPRDISGRPPISRLGEAFGSNLVVRTITGILKEHFKGAWVTFSDVPNDVVGKMYSRFKTRWSWDTKNEQMSYEGFRNVLKRRYRDIMGKMRPKAVEKAKQAGHVIEKQDPRLFSIIRDFPPKDIYQIVWRDMCEIWDKDDWRKKSESGTRNRTSTDSTDKRCRHTGGPLGFDEHKIRLKNETGLDPSFRRVFLETHLTKESKAKLRAGELEINNLEGMDFCTNRAGEIYADYLKEMKELHGPEFTEDDANVWKRVQAGGRTTRLYGIGSTDINYLMTGNPSSSFGAGTSQDKVLALENQIQVSETRLEDFEARHQAQREADRKAFEDALKAQREAMQKDFEELIKSYRHSSN